MSSVYGKNIKVSIFGQSHSQAVGLVLDGIPAGERIDTDKLSAFMQRRAPGRSSLSTARNEPDEPLILSGIVDGVTCGAPIAALIENKDARSGYYDEYKSVPRPSHADYPASVKFGKAHDIRGGGYFSGRLTAPLCFAGAVCSQILERREIFTFSHILSVGSIIDEKFDTVNVSCNEMEYLSKQNFRTLNPLAGQRMKARIEELMTEGDSIGGSVECCILGLPAGIGEPIFDGIENKIAQAVFAIPGVKGIEFGEGFRSAYLKGSQNNDTYCVEDGRIRTRTNNSGGVLGGLSTGMPLIFNTAFKPTPSIAKGQKTLNVRTGEKQELFIKGRHDPCIVPRAAVCVEAAAMIAALDLLYDEYRNGY